MQVIQEITYDINLTVPYIEVSQIQITVDSKILVFIKKGAQRQLLKTIQMSGENTLFNGSVFRILMNDKFALNQKFIKSNGKLNEFQVKFYYYHQQSSNQTQLLGVAEINLSSLIEKLATRGNAKQNLIQTSDKNAAILFCFEFQELESKNISKQIQKRRSQSPNIIQKKSFSRAKELTDFQEKKVKSRQEIRKESLLENDQINLSNEKTINRLSKSQEQQIHNVQLDTLNSTEKKENFTPQKIDDKQNLGQKFQNLSSQFQQQSQKKNLQKLNEIQHFITQEENELASQLFQIDQKIHNIRTGQSSTVNSQFQPQNSVLHSTQQIEDSLKIESEKQDQQSRFQDSEILNPQISQQKLIKNENDLQKFKQIIQEMNHKLALKNQQNQELTRQNESLEEQIKYFQQLINNIQQKQIEENQILKSQIQQYTMVQQQQFDILQSQDQSLQKSTTEKQEQNITSRSIDLDKIQSELQSYQEQVKNQFEEIKQLKQQIQAKDLQLSNIQQNQKNLDSVRNIELEKQDNELSIFKQQNLNLNNQIKTLTLCNQDLKKQLQQIQVGNDADLKKQYAQISEENYQLKFQIAKMQTQIQDLQMENQQVSTLENQIKELQDNYKKQMFGQLKIQESMQQEILRVSSEKNKKEKEIENLQIEISDLNQKMLILKSNQNKRTQQNNLNNSESMNQNLKLELENQKLNDSITSLSFQVQEYEQEIQKLRKLAQNMQQSLVAKEKEIHSIKIIMSELEQQTIQSKQILADAINTAFEQGGEELVEIIQSKIHK